MYKNHFDSNNMPVLLSIQRKMAIGHGYCSQFVYVEAYKKITRNLHVMYSPQVKKLYQTGLLAFTCSQTLMFITNAESPFSYHAEQMEFQGQRKSFEPKKIPRNCTISP